MEGDGVLRIRLERVRGTTATALAVVLMVAPLGAALAATAAPRPVISWAHRTVGFHRAATVAGRIERGTPGQWLRLERRMSDGAWRQIASLPTDEDNRARFKLHRLRKSASYRLVYADDAGHEHRSDVTRIGVRPRLRLHTSRRNVMNGRRVRVYGSLWPKHGGRRVAVAQRVAGEWRRVAYLRAGDGRFSTFFRSGRLGTRALRVRFSGDGMNDRSSDRTEISIFRPDLATWYGPGLYGNRTACGQRLGYGTLGVAHRSLPCGTDVSILYGGRTITVPVIDRGPYSSANWDLTEETADRLGFSGRGTIGTHR